MNSFYIKIQKNEPERKYPDTKISKHMHLTVLPTNRDVERKFFFNSLMKKGKLSY